MKNKILNNNSEQLLHVLEQLIRKYNQKVTSGVVFELNEKEYPLELLKVLNLIKDRLQKWGNTNIFTYLGNLFKTRKVIVIGAESINHAVELVILVYLTQILKANRIDELYQFKENLEDFINNEINSNMVAGYPYNSEIENEIKNHINKIIKENFKNSY